MANIEFSYRNIKFLLEIDEYARCYIVNVPDDFGVIYMRVSNEFYHDIAENPDSVAINFLKANLLRIVKINESITYTPEFSKCAYGCLSSDFYGRFANDERVVEFFRKLRERLADYRARSASV